MNQYVAVVCRWPINAYQEPDLQSGQASQAAVLQLHQAESPAATVELCRESQRKVIVPEIWQHSLANHLQLDVNIILIASTQATINH